MKKRGQFIANLFKYILIAIVAVIIIFFGFNAINKVRRASSETGLILFENNLKKSVNSVSGYVGSINEENFNVPADIENIYFIDLNEEIDGDIKNESKLIYDSLVSRVEKNVFFMKNGKIVDSIYIPELKLRYPYYRCFETFQTGRMALYLEGYGGGTNIEHVNHFYNCGYIPVLMEDDEVNDDVIEGKDVDNSAEATNQILGGGTPYGINKPTAMERIKDTRENVFLGRKVDIKKEGTNIKIRIKTFGGKTADDFTYVESIPKACINQLAEYLNIVDLIMRYPGVYIDPDPLIVWHFNDETITDKKEIEYELNAQLDCMRLINALGFGEIS